MSGDPLQLGPIIQSLVATLYGMEVSLLERMMGRDAYQRDKDRFADHGNYDPLLVSDTAFTRCASSNVTYTTDFTCGNTVGKWHSLYMVCIQ